MTPFSSDFGGHFRAIAGFWWVFRGVFAYFQRKQVGLNARLALVSVRALVCGVPVAAIPITSRPCSAIGHASAWIGVGCVNPLQDARYLGGKFKSANERKGRWSGGAPVTTI